METNLKVWYICERIWLAMDELLVWGDQGNPKTGVIFEGAPNIDHTQDFVRSDLKDWMRWVRHDLGFSDFRFDFSKGYESYRCEL